MPRPLLVLEHDLAVALVAHVELARVAVGPLLEDVMRRMTGTGTDIGEPRLVGRDHLRVADEFDCLVGDVLRQVVAVLGQTGRCDGVIVVDEFGIPLVGLAAHEAVEPFESPRQRPMSFGGGEIGLLQRSQMPLADAIGVVAVFGEDFRQQRGVVRDASVAAREPVGELLDGRHADGGGVASGQQRRPGRRAQRGGVELREPDTALGDAAHRRHLHQTTEAVPGRDAGVVPHEIENVGRTFRRRRRGIGTPVGFRIPDVEFDPAVEFRRLAMRRRRLHPAI